VNFYDDAPITIGYQGDQTIPDSFSLSKIVGFGSLTKK